MLQGAHQYYEVELPGGAKGRLEVPHLADHPAGAPTAFALVDVHVQLHSCRSPGGSFTGRTCVHKILMLRLLDAAHDAVLNVYCFITC